MKKYITIDSIVTPEFVGYGDRGAVWHDDRLVWHDNLSACPNPYQPKTGKAWAAVYAWLSPGKYKWRTYNSPKHGRCLLLNEGADIPTRNPNENHSGLFIATEVLIHKGDSDIWRGSAACITLAPALWDSFIACFDLIDNGELAIIDKIPRGEK